MIRACRQTSGLMSHVLMTLAALALVVKILVPQGFMAAPAGADMPFALVICTGDGMLTLDADGAVSDEAPSNSDEAANHNGPCLFAGNGPAVDGPGLIDVAAPVYQVLQPAPVRPLTDLAPGRGLTAPPLPPRGPPTLLI